MLICPAKWIQHVCWYRGGLRVSSDSVWSQSGRLDFVWAVSWKRANIALGREVAKAERCSFAQFHSFRPPCALPCEVYILLWHLQGKQVNLVVATYWNPNGLLTNEHHVFGSSIPAAIFKTCTCLVNAECKQNTEGEEPCSSDPCKHLFFLQSSLETLYHAIILLRPWFAKQILS